MLCRYRGDHGAVLAKRLSLPRLTHHNESLFHQGAALVHLEAEGRKLFGQVAHSDAENQPAVRKRIE